MLRRLFASGFRPILMSIAACLTFFSVTFTSAQNTPVSVLTQRYNNLRNGLNNQEAVLNTSNLQSGTFGRIFSKRIPSSVVCQPLYVPGLTIQGTIRNVVFVASQNGSIYAIDADSPLVPILWTANLVPSGASLSWTEAGQYSTPVIDPVSGTIYAVCKTVQGAASLPGSHAIMLHALDLITGKEKPGSPVRVNATVHGRGTTSVRGAISLIAMNQDCKTSLLLTQGKVVFGFAAGVQNETTQGYHGFVVAYDAVSLQQVGAWCSTPNGQGGGIWQSSNGLTSDDNGNVWVTTGNGTTNPPTNDYGEAVVRLTLSNSGLTLADYFIPYNYAQLNQHDGDLGVNGPVWLPGMNYLLQGSKQGYLYALAPFNLGQLETANGANIPQSVFATNGYLNGDPTAYVGPGGISTVFFMGASDVIRGFTVLPNGLLDTSTGIQSTVTATAKMGGFLSVSSLGSSPGTGILWCYRPTAKIGGTTPAILEAYDPTSLDLLWSSSQNPSRDLCGTYAGWHYPTIANGKVYLASSSYDFDIYGLIPNGIPPVPAGLSATISPPNGISISWPAVPGAIAYNVRSGAIAGGP